METGCSELVSHSTILLVISRHCLSEIAAFPRSWAITLLDLETFNLVSTEDAATGEAGCLRSRCDRIELVVEPLRVPLSAYSTIVVHLHDCTLSVLFDRSLINL